MLHTIKSIESMSHGIRIGKSKKTFKFSDNAADIFPWEPSIKYTKEAKKVVSSFPYFMASPVFPSPRLHILSQYFLTFNEPRNRFR
jgi:hypothetical protein